MKLGISGQALAGVKTLEEIFQLLKSYGIEYIELWGDNIPFEKNKTGYSGGFVDKDAEYVLSLMQVYNIKVSCVTFGGAFDETLFKGDSRDYSDQLVAAVKFAEKVGAKTVNHYCFYISMEEINLERIEQYMRPAIIQAKKSNITLALENEAHDSTAKPEMMKQILELIGEECFKTNFDATNYYHAGCEGFPYSYNLLKDYIAYVHIKNGCIFDKSMHDGLDGKGTPMSGIFTGNTIFYPQISDGAVNIGGLIMRLKDDRYEGFVTLEPHVSPQSVDKYYESEIKYLKEHNYM